MKPLKRRRRTVAKNDDNQAVVLNDGTKFESRSTRVGKLTCLSDVPDEDRQAVKDVLLTALSKKPDVLSDLQAERACSE